MNWIRRTYRYIRSRLTGVAYAEDSVPSEILNVPEEELDKLADEFYRLHNRRNK